MQFNFSRIMLVVAHPDDEVLGPGGTVHRLIRENSATVHVVILGEGLTSRLEIRDTQKWASEMDTHRKNIFAARAAIGYQSVSIYDFPDNRFDSVPLLDIIKVVEKEKVAFQPEVIFTHHGGDLNVDHQKTFEAVLTSCRPLADETVKTILAFETMSGTEWRASTDPRHFIPNLFFSITNDDLLAKIIAMESYYYEKRPHPHPRSPQAIKNRALMWGITTGVEFAEAFMLIRLIN